MLVTAMPRFQRRVLRRAGQRLGVELEALVDEGLGQIGRGVLDQVDRQVVLPGFERLTRDQRRHARHRGRMPDDEIALSAEPPAKYSCQSRPGALGSKSLRDQ